MRVERGAAARPARGPRRARRPRRRGGGRRPRPDAPGRRHARRHEPGRVAGRARCWRGPRPGPARSGASSSSAHGWPTFPYLAVTGTNGKTTTVELLAACLRADGIDGRRVRQRRPSRSRWPRARATRRLVVEASSFQLRFADSFHPRVSVLLNLAPDHLDWHGSFEAYARREGADLREPDRRATRTSATADDPAAAAVSWAAPCPVRWFRTGDAGRTARSATTPRASSCRGSAHGARLGWVGRRPGRVPRRRRRGRRGRALLRRRRRRRSPPPSLGSSRSATGARRSRSSTASGSSTTRRRRTSTRRWPPSPPSMTPC